jgi:hypothetical protein
MTMEKKKALSEKLRQERQAEALRKNLKRRLLTSAKKSYKKKVELDSIASTS